MTTASKVAEQYRCDRCQRGVTVRGTPADVAAAIEAVRCRHRDGHAAGDHVLDDIGRARASARANARARRAVRRAAARAAARRRDQRRATG